MTPEKQQINEAIRQATGIDRNDFDSDLNAMAEVDKLITDEQWPEFKDMLHELAFKACPPRAKYFRPHCATAAQRAEAFLRCIGKWEE